MTRRLTNLEPENAILFFMQTPLARSWTMISDILLRHLVGAAATAIGGAAAYDDGLFRHRAGVDRPVSASVVARAHRPLFYQREVLAQPQWFPEALESRVRGALGVVADHSVHAVLVAADEDDLPVGLDLHRVADSFRGIREVV